MRTLVMFLAFILSLPIWALQYKTKSATYIFNDKTGEISSVIRNKDNYKSVIGTENHYLMMNRYNDFRANGAMDKVSNVKATRKDIVFTCTNEKLPDIVIVKRYFVVNDSLYREFTFTNNSSQKRYIIPFTDVHFAKSVFDKAYYFGAGYLGPYQPVEKVSSPTRVEKYVQSSKGMVLINPDNKRGSFANVRVKINNTVVWPWWQSTIGRYREMEDRLYYLPDGWRMCWGTLDLEQKGGKISYTDFMAFFHGDLHNFFNNIMLKNPDFNREIKSLPKANDFLTNFFAMPQWGHEPYLKYLVNMASEGNIIFRSMLSADWGDYRWRNGLKGKGNGFITGKEIRDYIQNINKISPRIAMGAYSIIIATDKYSKLYKEHPNWFRNLNRSGEEDSLFPGMFTNYQSMLNKKECRDFFVNTLVDMSNHIGSRYIYVDEAQQQNTINYQQNELIRDDHNTLFYNSLRKNAIKNGKFLFFNGSGNPYADLNFMECNPRQLVNENWRDFAGVVLGIELFSKFRPDSRMALLYWRKNFEYLPRCLSTGWIIVPNIDKSLAHMKAGSEIGKTFPIRVDYQPDFYTNSTTNVESYAVRRKNSKDILLSFINHDLKKSTIPVCVNLKSLPYNKDENISVFAIEIDCSNNNNPYTLSDKEHQDNYIKYQWHNRAISKVKLIYSGKCSGLLKHTFNNTIQKNIGQLLFVPNNLGIHSVNGIERNYYFSRHYNVEIKGNKVVSKVDNAELLFASLNEDLEKVYLNNKEVKVKSSDIAGVKVQLFNVPKGTYTIKLVKGPKKVTTKKTFTASYNPTKKVIEVKGQNLQNEMFVLTKDNKTIKCGFAPLSVPEKYENGTYFIRQLGVKDKGQAISLKNGKPSSIRYQDYPVIPPKMVKEKTNISLGSAKIISQATWVSKHRKLRNLQENILPYVVSVNAAKYTLVAGTTRREDTLDANQYAGFEIENVKSLRIKLTNTFYNVHSLRGDNTHTYNDLPKKDFSGLVVDYQVDGKYTKRVCFSIGLGSPLLTNSNPAWGKGKVQDIHVTLGNMLNKKETIFSLDIAKYAPKNWNGKVFFAIGNNHILASRVLTCQLLGANENNPKDFIEGFAFGQSKKVKKDIPSILYLPKAKTPIKSLDFMVKNYWNKAAKIESLLPYPGDDAVSQNTIARLVYDKENLYIAVRAFEKLRTIVAKSAVAYNNDRIEVFLKNKEGKIVQIIVDVKGRKFVLPRNIDSQIITYVNNLPFKHIDYFVTIPWKSLGYNDIYPGVKIPFNLCRMRLDPGLEKSSYGPCRTLYGFRDVEKYGIICIGREVTGMGRYEEF